MPTARRRFALRLGLSGIAVGVALTCATELRFLAGPGRRQAALYLGQSPDLVVAGALRERPGYVLCERVRRLVPPDAPLVFQGNALNLAYVRFFLFPRAVYAVEYDGHGASVWNLAATVGAAGVLVAEERETFETREGAPADWVHSGAQPQQESYLAPLHFYRRASPD